MFFPEACCGQDERLWGGPTQTWEPSGGSLGAPRPQAPLGLATSLLKHIFMEQFRIAAEKLRKGRDYGLGQSGKVLWKRG